jgi:hypothetical protein
VGQRRLSRSPFAPRPRAGNRAEPVGGERSPHGRGGSIECRITPPAS